MKRIQFSYTQVLMWTLLCLAGTASCTKAEFALDPGNDAGDAGESDVVADDGQDDTMAAVDGTSDDEVEGGDVTDTGSVLDAPEAAGSDATDAIDAVDGGQGEANADLPTGVMPTVLGQIVVSEVMNDPNVVADAYGEWFEVYNPGDSTTFDLRGCQISDASSGRHIIASSLVIPPKSFRTLAVHAKRTPTSPFGVAFEPDYVYTGVRFGNTHGDGVILSCAGITIATFIYATPNMTMAGHSFSVDPAHYQEGDNQVPGHWCPATDVYDFDPQMIVKDFGTPGRTNPSCN